MAGAVSALTEELRFAADGQTRRSARLLIEAADEIERLERELTRAQELIAAQRLDDASPASRSSRC